MIVSDWKEVPEFSGEKEEAAFWDESQLDVRLMENSVMAGSTSKDSVTITIRMEPRMLSKIKWIARTRFLNYQSMIKQWLSERMEEENKK